MDRFLLKFLTSVVVCSAFGVVVAPSSVFAEWPYGIGKDAEDNGYIGAYQAGGSSINSAFCGDTPLIYQNAPNNYGTYTLTAQWQVDQCPITLDSHTGNGEYGASPSSPSTLYAKYGDDVYLESAYTHAMSATANDLTTDPTGKTFTLTLDPNLTGLYGNPTTVSNFPSNPTATMQFKGFYNAVQSVGTTTNGTKYIDEDGFITQFGITAGTQISKDNNGDCEPATWHAQYTCQNVTLPSNVGNLTGFDFKGWFDGAGQDATEVTGPICLTSDQTVYAHWEPKHYTVVYHAGNCDVSNPNYVIYTDDTPTYGQPYNEIPDNGTEFRNNYNSWYETRLKPGYDIVMHAQNMPHWATTPNATTVDFPHNTYTLSTGNTWVYTGNETTIHVYAVCLPKEYRITYNCAENGGSVKTGVTGTDYTMSGIVKDYPIEYGSDYPLRSPLNVCEKPNATPGSTWSCTWITDNPDSDNPVWHELQTWDPNQTGEKPWAPWSVDALEDFGADSRFGVTCYASYVTNSYSITYKCGTLPNETQLSGSEPYDNVTNGQQNYPIKLNASAMNCGADGYHFTGWKCDDRLGNNDSGELSDGKWVYGVSTPSNHPESVFYDGGITIGLSGNTICTAQWEANSVNLVYLKNEGDTTNYDTGQCQYGLGTFQLPSEPTKTGHTFIGWKVENWSPE